MADAIVGRVGIRVKPETNDFARDLKAKLESIERQLKLSIPVELEDSSVRRLQDRLKSIGENIRVKVDVDEANFNRLGERLRDLSKDAKIKVDFEAGDLRATENLLKAFREKQMGGIHVDALTDSLRNVKTTITADANTVAAETQLNEAARDRVASLSVKINEGGSGGGIGNRFVNFASNFNEINEFTRSVGRMVSSISLAIPKVMLLGSAIGGLSGMVLAAASNAFGLVSALGQLVPLGLVVPGVLTGFGVGFGVLIAALVDAKTILADIGPMFTALQDSISSSYWERAAQPLREMFQTLLPAIQGPLSAIAGQLGQMTLGLARMFTMPENIDRFLRMFSYVRDSIDVAGEGVVTFSEQILKLVDFGSSYLPRLASAFNHLSWAFESWLDTNFDNGNMARWVENSIQAWKDLGRIILQTIEFFGAIGAAARAGGGVMSLGDLADGMERMNEALRGPFWQVGLARWFESGHRAMSAMGDGFRALGDGLYNLSYNIGDIMAAAGAAFGELLGVFGDILGHPVFATGLQEFFEGIHAGFEGLRTGMPGFSTILGSLLDVLGSLAEIVGPSLGAAFNALAPLVSDLAIALEPLLSYLSENLPRALELVLPPLVELAQAVLPVLVEFFSDLVRVLQEMGEEIGPVAEDLLPRLGEIFNVLVTEVLPPLLDLFLQLLPIMGTVISELLPPLVELLEALVPIISDYLVPALEWLADVMETHMIPSMELIIETVGGVIEAIGTLWSSITEWANERWDIFTNLPTLIEGAFELARQSITTAVEGWFTEIGTGVDTGIGVVETQMNETLAELGVAVALGVGEIVRTFSNLPNQIQSVLIGMQTMLPQFMMNGMLGMAEAVGTGIGNLLRFFIDLPGQIVSTLAITASSLYNQGLQWFASLQASVVNGSISMLAQVATIPARVVGAVAITASLLYNQGLYWFSQLTAAVTNGIVQLIANTATIPHRVISSVQVTGALLFAEGYRWFTQLQSAVTVGIANVLNNFRSLGIQIVQALANVPGQLRTIGGQMMEGLIEGIRGMAARVASIAAEVVGTAVDAAREALGINSPSRVFMEIGHYVGEGFTSGMDSETENVRRSMESLVNDSIPLPPDMPSVEGIEDATGASRGSVPIDVLQAALSGMTVNIPTDYGVIMAQLVASGVRELER